MNIVVISGSMRSLSQSLKVSNWLVSHGQALGYQMSLIDLHEKLLPLYDDGESEAENKDWIMTKLENADACVFVSPEWNGTMSHGLVNMLQYVDNQLANKPITLVGVSSGRGGHYPLMQMRNMVYKNNHFVISPESLLVQGVKDIMNTPELTDDETPDNSVKKRADYALRVLAEYAKALKTVRESGVIDLENFANGV